MDGLCVDAEATSVLVSAIYGGCTECVEVILDKGVNPNQRLEKGGSARTPLMEAIHKDSLPTVRLLLARGAGIEARDKFQVNKNISLTHTPLMQAAQQGSLNITQELLGRGADLEAEDEIGARPLMLAAWGGHAEVAKLLLAKGAQTHAKSKDGDTALALAYRQTLT